MKNDHMVEKKMRDYDVKKVLSDHMKSLGYKALQGCGGDINMHFASSRSDKPVSFDEVVFEVQDLLNPEPEQIYISKKEAIEIVAKAKKINLNSSNLTITS